MFRELGEGGGGLGGQCQGTGWPLAIVFSVRLLPLFALVTMVASGQWMVEELLPFGNWLRSTHCREVLLDTLQTRSLRSTRRWTSRRASEEYYDELFKLILGEPERLRFYFTNVFHKAKKTWNLPFYLLFPSATTNIGIRVLINWIFACRPVVLAPYWRRLRTTVPTERTW